MHIDPGLHGDEAPTKEDFHVGYRELDGISELEDVRTILIGSEGAKDIDAGILCDGRENAFGHQSLERCAYLVQDCEQSFGSPHIPIGDVTF